MPMFDKPDAENLRRLYLTDKQAEYVLDRNPGVGDSFASYCPTCSKRGSYKWKGETVTCDCQLQLQLHKHYLNAGIGNNYQRLSWDDYSGYEVAKDSCLFYVEKHKSLVPRGMGLLFLGSYGVGKTLAANLVLKDMVKLGYSCYGTTFTQLVSMFTAGWKSTDEQNRFKHKIKESRILLIDDLGKEMTTRNDIGGSVFDDVIRQRVQEGRPTFVTSNKSMSDIARDYGGAVESLLRESTIKIDFLGGDWRPQANERLIVEVENDETRPIF